MINFQAISYNISIQTKGRIRVLSDHIRIRSLYKQDAGIYSCVEISRVHGIRYKHYNINILMHNNSWLEFSNPNVVLKLLLLFLITIVIIPWSILKLDHIAIDQQ